MPLKSQSHYFTVLLDELKMLTQQISNTESDAFAASLLEADRIFIAGVGRSGFAARAFANRLMQIGCTVYIVGDTTTPAFDADSLLVICSGSGETGSLVSMAQKAKQVGGKIALITIAPQSSIARLACCNVFIPAPSPKASAKQTVQSAQPMGTLFEQGLWLFLDTIITRLMKMRHISSEEMFFRHANLE